MYTPLTYVLSFLVAANHAVNAEGRISRHDSAWDQGWDEVRSQVVGGRE